MDRPLSPSQARSLTDEIKATAESRWTLVAEVYTAEVWGALGYPSWEAYCAVEFGPDRLRLPWRKRRQTVAYLQEAGLTYQAIESVTVRRPVQIDVAGEDPAPSAPERAHLGPEDQLGFTQSELDLIGSLLSVSDAEFEQVLAAGHRVGNLSKEFIEATSWKTARTRASVEDNLTKAAKALDRACGLIARCDTDLPAQTAAVADMLNRLEDRGWDLLDEVDDLSARFHVNDAPPS